MKASSWRIQGTALVFLAAAAHADILQGVVTDATTSTPLQGVSVSSDSAHTVYTGDDGTFILDTQNNSAGLALPQSHEIKLRTAQKAGVYAKNPSASVGGWGWFNLLGRPVGARAAAALTANADKADALAKASANQALNALTFQKTGYTSLTMSVDGSSSALNVQMQSIPVGGEADNWYEAEAPGNKVTNLFGDGGKTKCGSTCAGTPKEGDACCMGGYKITQLLGRCDTKASAGSTKECQDSQGPGGTGVLFNGINAPKSGTYDVTWWYHCGAYDNWNDHDCGGKPAPAWMTYFNPQANPQPGCRPHVIVINGKQAVGPAGEKYWQFPCFGGSWDILHAATTTLTLAAGNNSVQLAAPRIGDLDAVDIDAIHVQAVNKGNGPRVVAPTAIAGDGQK